MVKIRRKYVSPSQPFGVIMLGRARKTLIYECMYKEKNLNIRAETRTQDNS